MSENKLGSMDKSMMVDKKQAQEQIYDYKKKIDTLISVS
jgi:hypothetical protein